MKIKHEDILNATEDAILQQCNCVARKPHGLSQQIYDKFPYCKVYVNRPGKSPNTASVPAIPGTIEIFSDLRDTDDKRPDIICLLGQYGMGLPGSFGCTKPDSHELRLKWFSEAISKIDQNKYIWGNRSRFPYKSIAVQWKIGCGLAGGSWSDYLPIIEELDKRIPVTIYKNN